MVAVQIRLSECDHSLSLGRAETRKLCVHRNFYGMYNHLNWESRKWRVLTSGLVMILSLAFWPTAVVSADETPVERLTQGLLERVSFDVNAFEVLGNNPISESVTQKILKPYLGQARGIDDIESAADALEKAIAAQGLSFYRVSFPPQELTDGIVELLVKPYLLGNVAVQGNKHYSKQNIVNSLPVLKSGSAPSTKKIAESLRLANENAAKRVRVTLVPGDRANEIDAKITVVDQKPLAFTTWLNNTGTDVSGDFRVGASVSHHNLFGLDHDASLSFITSPEGTNDVQQFAASYRVPFYHLGGSLNFVAVVSDIDSGTVGGIFDVAGRGEVFGVGYTHSLSSIDRYHHSLSLQFSDKLFDNDIRFLGNQLLEDVRSRPLTLAYQSTWGNDSGLALSSLVSISSNTSGGSFNDLRSYQLSRIGAVDDWQKLDFGVTIEYSKAKWLYRIASKLSLSDDRLITGEQFAVGGTNSVRGMEERELRGDEGYLINLQAWAPELSKGLRPIVFVDIGHIENNSPLRSELSSESVLSAGVLFNWNPIDKISASASYGYLLDGIDGGDQLNSSSRDGDSKVHFNIAYRF